MQASKRSITLFHPHFMLAVGSSLLFLEVTKRMAQRGWEVQVISSKSDPEIVADARRAGVRFTDVGGPISSSIWFWVFFPFIYYRVHRAARAVGTTVLVSGAFPAIWWGWLYRFFNRDVFHIYYCLEPSAFIYNKDWTKSITPVYMRWGLQVFGPLLRYVENVLHPYSDYIVAISEYTRNEVVSVFPDTDPSKLKRIYCGINHEQFFDPKIERRSQIAIVGTLAKFKHADWVVEALHILKKQNRFKDTKLIIKGKGGEKENLEALTQRLNLEDSVQIIDSYFTGEQLRNLLGSSRVVVHAAHNEAFGLAPVEAMACGTPVVVTGTGGTGETVLNGKTGLYFKPGDIADLARQLEILLSDDALWAKLSVGAINRAQDFTWEKNTDEFCRLLEQIALRDAQPVGLSTR